MAGVNYRTTETWRGSKVETLADILAPDLACVFVGLNPSPVSIEAGHYMQGTLGKQFWRLLQRHDILPPSTNGQFPDELLLANSFGFTDLAKRPTPRATGLAREDIETGRVILREKIERFQPRILCSVYRSSIEALMGRKYTKQFGLLPDTVGETRLFALPFPYRPSAQVTEHFTTFRQLIEEARRG